MTPLTRILSNFRVEQNRAAGDRVCAIAANSAESVIAMLAVTSLGGVFSSCSPDFGVQGILERWGTRTF